MRKFTWQRGLVVVCVMVMALVGGRRAREREQQYARGPKQAK